MRPRTIFAILVVLVLAGAAAGYAYDDSRSDVIARGVTVAGVDVGGMRAAEARTELEARLARALQGPLTVQLADRAFTLTAREAGLRADVDAMLAEALRRSRAGNLLSRTVRSVAGAGTDVEVRPRMSYSKRAVGVFVSRVKAVVDRPAEDARVSYSAAGLATVPARDGRAVRAQELKRAIARALSRVGGSRSMSAPVDVTRPRIATNGLAAKYPAFITVDRANFRLRFYRDLRLAKTYKIAVGQVGLETPAGLYHIQNKAVNPAWSVPDKAWAGKLAGKVIPSGSPDNPIRARWMGIYDGAGIHGTADIASLGTAASHGCIRMAIPDVTELYKRVPLHTPAYIG